MKKIFEQISINPIVLLVLMLFLEFVIIWQIAGIIFVGKIDCNTAIQLVCISEHIANGNTSKVAVDVLVLLDFGLIFIISIIFCLNYNKIFRKMESIFGDAGAKTLWSQYGLGRDAIYSVFVLNFLMLSWIIGAWFIYAGMLLLIYIIFITSNRNTLSILTGRLSEVRNSEAHKDLLLDTLSIARDENIHSVTGYLFLFSFTALAFIGGYVVGADTYLPLVMKGFLAGAATIHLSLSALKFWQLMQDESDLLSTTARLGNYSFEQGDKLDEMSATVVDRICAIRVVGGIVVGSVSWASGSVWVHYSL